MEMHVKACLIPKNVLKKIKSTEFLDFSTTIYDSIVSFTQTVWLVLTKYYQKHPFKYQNKE